MGRKTWLSPVVDLVQEKTGTPPNYKSWAKEIAVLHKECGFTMKAIVGNLKEYLAKTQVRYISAPRFRVTFTDWNPGRIGALEIDRQLDRDLEKRVAANRSRQNDTEPGRVSISLDHLRPDHDETHSST